jgi:hypothetical protein
MARYFVSYFKGQWPQIMRDSLRSLIKALEEQGFNVKHEKPFAEGKGYYNVLREGEIVGVINNYEERCNFVRKANRLARS